MTTTEHAEAIREAIEEWERSGRSFDLQAALEALDRHYAAMDEGAA